MDLSLQIGVILVMGSMFALVVYFYSDSIERGQRVEETLNEPTTNYSLDSSVTSPTFFVDSRVFVQWALNAKDQRDVYLIYSPVITPSTDIYGQYLYSVQVTLDTNDISARTLVVNPQSASYTPNAFFVNDQSEKTIAFLDNYASIVKSDTTTKGVVTIRTFKDPKSLKVIYVCFIK